MKNHMKYLGMISMMLVVFSSCKREDPNAPVSCFVIPDEIFAGEPATFNSSCSANAISFLWDFGDGSSSVDVNPVHTYMQDGAFTVSLSIESADGKTDGMTVNVNVMAPEFIEHSGTIDSDETWIEGVHLVTSDVHVDGATLTIAPGAVIKFASGAALYVGYHSGSSGATLIANGTASKQITFTSAAATQSEGDWDYIWFDEGASNVSSMQYCTVEYGGGYSNNYGAIQISSSAVSIQNSTVKLSGSHGFTFDSDGYFESFSDNLVEQNALSAISIYGNYVHTIGAGNTLMSEQGIVVKADNLEMASVTWLKQTTAYVVEGTLRVGSQSGTSLTLAPGVEVRMGSGASMEFGYSSGTFGTLTAVGTQNERILFTSSAPEGSKSPGDWDYLWFDDGAGTSSTMAYCDMEYGGGYSANYGMIYLKGSGIAVTNSTISLSESQGIALSSDAKFTDCSDNVFEDNGSFPIEIHGNFAHTVGSGNSFNSGPGILVKGDKVEQAEITWLKQDVPYIVDGRIELGSAAGSKLIVEPGATVNFSSGSDMRVGYLSGTFGILVADGEPGNKITFSSAAPAGFESAGDWDGIWFYDGTSNGSILDNCIISYGGGYSSNSGNLIFYNDVAEVPVISNCEISNSAAWGIYLQGGANPTLTDNTFISNASGDSN